MGRFNRFIAPALIACVAVGAGVLAGCGGGSDSSTTAGASGASGASGGTPLSQTEFVSQADAACKEGNTKVEALTAPQSTSDLSTIATFLAEEVSIGNDLFAQLSAITPPSNLQAKYTQYLSDGKAQIDVAQQTADAAKAGDQNKVDALVQKLGSTSTDPEAKSLGLTECAKNPQPQG